MEVVNVNVKLDLIAAVHKKIDVAPEVLKCLAVETIAARHPSSQWLHVFTDGFQFKCHHNVGANVFSDLFSFYPPAGYMVPFLMVKLWPYIQPYSNYPLSLTNLKKLSFSLILRQPSNQSVISTTH